MATRKAAPSTNHPEKKFGPVGGGISVAVWINTIETDDGPRQVRSLTISPRRYLDQKTGDWKDSGSFRPSDIPALVFALEKAMEYMFTTPIPGQSPEDEEPRGRGTF